MGTKELAFLGYSMCLVDAGDGYSTFWMVEDILLGSRARNGISSDGQRQVDRNLVRLRKYIDVCFS